MWSSSPVAVPDPAPIEMNILAYEHVGIRVSDRDRALEFYGALGFREVAYFPDYPANEMATASGIRINLIFNGARSDDAVNVLFEGDERYAGVTHPAFVVDDIDAVLATFKRYDIPITEGPIDIEGRRRALFIRDPDGTVLEFDELL